MVAYCVRVEPTGRLDGWVRGVKQQCGINLGQPEFMSRTEQNGTLVSWALAWRTHQNGVQGLPLGGLSPFAIDWGDAMVSGVHPSLSAPGADQLSLVGIRGCTPMLERASEVLDGMGILHAFEGGLVERQGEPASLQVLLQTPKGEVWIA